MKRRSITGSALVIAALVVAAVVSCGSDDSTNPNTTTGTPVLTIPAGTYSSTFNIWPCGDTEPPALTETTYFCDTQVVDEFYIIPCPMRASGDNVTINCSLRTDVGLGCTALIAVDGQGTRGGGVWEISGTINISDAMPSNCFPDTCIEFSTSLTEIGGRAPMCDFANENTFDVTITGGPYGGVRMLEASGSQSSPSAPYFFDIVAEFDPNGGFLSPKQPFCFAPLCMTIQTSPIDPAALPLTLGIITQPNGGFNEALVTYEEFRTDPFYQFSADTPITGEIVVEHVSADYIAGTIDMTLEGDETILSTNRAQRRIAGGFFVLNDVVVNRAHTPAEQLALNVLESIWRSALPKEATTVSGAAR